MSSLPPSSIRNRRNRSSKGSRHNRPFDAVAQFLFFTQRCASSAHTVSRSTGAQPLRTLLTPSLTEFITMTLREPLAELVSACFSGIWILSHEHQDALLVDRPRRNVLRRPK